MFTGIIEAVGRVTELRARRGGARLRVAAPAEYLDRLRPGDSIAVSGCCLTIVELKAELPVAAGGKADGNGGRRGRGAAAGDGRAEGYFTADLAPETLRRTRFAALRAGDRLNLERPLRAGSLLSGHLVQGHVDGVGFARGRLAAEAGDRAPAGSRRKSGAGDGRGGWLEVRIPRAVLPFVVEKGSLAVEGVSLTVAALREDLAAFAIIPFTAAHTNLGRLRAGAPVNLEADLVARQVVAWLERGGVNPNGSRPRAAPAPRRAPSAARGRPGGRRWTVADFTRRGF